MAWDSVNQIISDAAVEVGLTLITSPFTSADSNYVQLRHLLKSGGRTVTRSRNWTDHRREHTFTTVLGQSAYDFPTDFRDMLPQTGWNRSSRLPLGEVSSQEWQYLSSRLTGVVLNVFFRQMQEKFHLYPAEGVPAGLEIAFEYQSKNWLRDSADALNQFDAPVSGADLVLLDAPLMVAKLKLDFLSAKGFDTTAAQRAYDLIYDSAASDDASSPVLEFGKRRTVEPLIGGQSVPFTGFGS